MADNRIVQPRTAAEVEAIARKARETFGLEPHNRVSMMALLEQVLYEVVDDYDFEVREDRYMGRVDGLTSLVKPTITLKQSIYHQLENGNPRARMTAAHELGHLLMHCRAPVYYAFSTGHQPLVDPERQANIFAEAFLMPRAEFIKYRSVSDVQRAFGVSRDAALCRARKLRHKLYDTPKKKGRKPMVTAP